jgi:hypothetical protein
VIKSVTGINPKIKVKGFPSLLKEKIVVELNKQGLGCTDELEFDYVLEMDPNVTEKNSKVIAYITEPEVVRPDLYSNRRLNAFIAIITISETRAYRIGADYTVSLPHPILTNREWEADRIPRTCAIFGNKFSAHIKSNYRLRRSLLKIDEKRENKIDLFGVDWLDPLWLQCRRRLFAVRQQIFSLSDFSIPEALGDFGYIPTNYKGIMDSGMKALARYETSLVIENQSDYVSEKLMNSFSFGSVPFYVGPDLRNSELRDLVIPLEGDVNNMLEMIYHTSTLEINKRRKNIKEFLKGYSYQANLEMFARKLGDITKQIIQN